MTPRDHDTSILYLALAEPIGLTIRTNDPIRAKQRLYSARAASGDPSLSSLQIRTSPSGLDDLTIVNRRVSDVS